MEIGFRHSFSGISSDVIPFPSSAGFSGVFLSSFRDPSRFSCFYDIGGIRQIDAAEDERRSGDLDPCK